MTLYDNLTVKCYGEGSAVALANAEKHLNIAGLLSSNKYYGCGISHLILAVEELAKASKLKLLSLNPSIQVKNIDVYFRRHEAKHSAIWRLFLASLSNINEMHSESTPEVKTVINQLGLNLELMDGIVILILILIFSWQSKTKFDIFANINMNTSRNNGFYVGYDSVKKQWVNPDLLYNEEQYITTKLFADKIFIAVKYVLFSGVLNKDNLPEFIEKLNDKNIIFDNITKIS